jgi:putative tricarboxylic transport membrane protein
LVLGRLLETSGIQSLDISGGDWTIFLTRPISGSLLCVAAIMILIPVYRALRSRWVGPAISEGAQG